MLISLSYAQLSLSLFFFLKKVFLLFLEYIKKHGNETIPITDLIGWEKNGNMSTKSAECSISE